MKQTNENVVQDQDVIDLGVASVETQGPGSGTEFQGKDLAIGIAEE